MDGLRALEAKGIYENMGSFNRSGSFFLKATRGGVLSSR